MAVTQKAIESIKAMIVSGELRPGDRLPRERELAQTLELSRSSLREAIRALSVLGVIDVRHGDGTYVTSLEPKQVLEALSFAVDLSQSATIMELFEVRKLLEPAATALSAARISQEQLAALEQILRAMRGASDVEELVELDERFHATITEATGNVVLASLLNTLSNRTVRARIWRGVVDRQAIDRTIEWHTQILQALRARDADMARAAELVHIAEGEEWIRQALERVDSNEGPA